MWRTGGVPSLGRWKERVSESWVEERRVGVDGALRGAAGTTEHIYYILRANERQSYEY